MYNSIDSFNTFKDGKITFGADNDTQQFTFGHNVYSNTNEVTGGWINL